MCWILISYENSNFIFTTVEKVFDNKYKEINFTIIIVLKNLTTLLQR